MALLNEKRTRVFVRAMRSVAIAASLTIAACAPEAQAPAAPVAIRIDGSSTVFPLTQAVVEAFRANAADAPEIQLAESGSTAGFTKFCAGDIDISDASRPINTRELIACFRAGVRYVEIPIAFDALTVVVHRDNPVRAMTLSELKTIWAPEAQGQVMSWRAVNARWADQPLDLFGPGAQSGTFDYFTEAVNGSAGASRTDYAASEDDNVIVQGVSASPNALGYVGFSYFLRNQNVLKALEIDGGAGPVAPSIETVASGAYKPLARPVFLYVNVAALDRPGVQSFVEYYVNNASRVAEAAGFTPLPEGAYAAYLERVQSRRAGTAFQGRAHAGETIEEVIARPLIESAGTSS